MSEHTKGPWKVYKTTNGLHVLGIGDSEAGGIVDGDGGLWRSDPERAANAHRIVDCVNALEGIANPSAIGEVVEALRWYAEPVFAYAITQANEPRSAVHADKGEIARAALAKLDNEGEE